jgi:aminocarboxymuconate-semialdehyde decarboxylase
MPTHDIPLNPYGSTAGREHMSGEVPRPKTLTVDLHNHYRVDAAANLVKPHLPTNDHPADRASELTQKIRAAHAVNRAKHMRDLDQRLADMEAMKLDVMAISCTPQQFYYVLEPSLGAESSHIVNDAIAAAVKAHPTRFTGIGTVPLQDTDLAIKELDRCVNDLGFGSVQIGCRVRNEELSAERLEPFWARCQEHDILVFLHPSSFESPRLRQHYQTNIVGNPLDTTVAVHYLIFDGVMDRHPGLKVCLAHGGGFLGAYPGRIDHAHPLRPDMQRELPKSQVPGDALKRFWFDSVVFTPEQLEFLADWYGADHVVMGTDYPYDMAETDPVGHVMAANLTDDQKRAILGATAAKLLRL